MFPHIDTFSKRIALKAANCYSMMDEQRDVFESQRHHVFSVAYYMTGDERTAESILEATFLAAFDRHPQPSIDTLDQALMEELHGRFSLAPVPAMQAGSEALGSRNTRRTDLEEALWQLPERERLCFLLRDVEGYSPSRIAALLTTSEPDVLRTTLSARLRLRSLLIQQRSISTAQAS